MIQREWRRVHLAGTFWWEGRAFPADRQRENARAAASQTKTEEQLAKLLAEGWTMVSVVSASPTRLFRNRAGGLWQETFNVFLERLIGAEGRLPQS